MVKLTFVGPDGRTYPVDIEAGSSARDAALFNDVPGIDGDCGGVCACATCHVHVASAWIDRIGRLAEGSMEAELLQFAEGATAESRLACQIKLGMELGSGPIKGIPMGVTV